MIVVFRSVVEYRTVQPRNLTKNVQQSLDNVFFTKEGKTTRDIDLYRTGRMREMSNLR